MNETNWVEHRKPTLTQIEPVKWEKDAAEGSQRSLSIIMGFIVNPVGVPECANLPQRF